MFTPRMDSPPHNNIMYATRTPSNFYRTLLGATWTLLYLATIIAAETRVEVSSPINPVPDGGIYSLSCRVWDLQSTLHEVTIQNTSKGITQRLSVDKEVLTSTSERVFLAVRQMKDGSVIYFLSIMQVSRQDEGKYSCKIVTKSEAASTLVDMASDVLRVQYFPAEPDPLCTPSDSMTLHAGQAVAFNCSTATAFPSVTMEWVRSGSRVDQRNMRIIKRGSRQDSILTIVPSSSDKDTVFICQVTSPAFPGLIRSCHVGPFHVISDSNGISLGPIKNPSNKPARGPTIDSYHSPGGVPDDKDTTTTTTSKPLRTFIDCGEVCSEYNSPVMFWVITTVVAGIIAVLFLFIGVGLFVKYFNLTSGDGGKSSDYESVRQLHEQVYVDVGGKMRDKQVYMTLMKQQP